MQEQDKDRYRHKGSHQTTVKTVYGEAVYGRTVYETMEGDGYRHYVYLLDEALHLDNVMLISTNIAERLVKGITELLYRECAAKASGMTGQTVSVMGVWNVIQKLGEKVCEEERQFVEEHKKGHIHGTKEAPLLFEEADGVYVKMQGKDRKSGGHGKAEVKVGMACDGWRKAGKGRYELPDKAVAAGFAGAKGSMNAGRRP